MKNVENTIKCAFDAKNLSYNNKIYTADVDKRWEKFKFFLDEYGKMV